jgi:hypothetical protein
MRYPSVTRTKNEERVGVKSRHRLVENRKGRGGKQGLCPTDSYEASGTPKIDRDHLRNSKSTRKNGVHQLNTEGKGEIGTKKKKKRGGR